MAKPNQAGITSARQVRSRALCDRAHYSVAREFDTLSAVDWVAVYAAAVSSIVGGTQVFTAVRNRRTKLEMNVDIVGHLPAAGESPEALQIDVHVKNVSSHDMGVVYVFAWAFTEGFDDLTAEPTFAAKDGPKTITPGRGWTHSMFVRLGDRPALTGSASRSRQTMTSGGSKKSASASAGLRSPDLRHRSGDLAALRVGAPRGLRWVGG
jgi:hypothetical protein